MPDPSATVLAPEDFYDEGPFVVFTAHYLRKRGYCCHSSCRHCPYDADGRPVDGKGEPPPSLQ